DARELRLRQRHDAVGERVLLGVALCAPDRVQRHADQVGLARVREVRGIRWTAGSEASQYGQVVVKKKSTCRRAASPLPPPTLRVSPSSVRAWNVGTSMPA